MFTVNIFSPRNDLYLRVSYMYCYYFNAFRKSNSSLSSLFIYQIVHILTYVNVSRGSRSLIEVKGHICSMGLCDCQRHSFLSTSCYYEIALKLILIVELTYWIALMKTYVNMVFDKLQLSDTNIFFNLFIKNRTKGKDSWVVSCRGLSG